jgi:hypothetical protein
MKYFKGFGSGFSKLHAKLDAYTLIDFAIRRRQNKTQSRKKYLYKNNASSQRSVIWQTDAVGLQKCDHGLPSDLLSPRQLQQ